jgi:phage shock protein A
MATDDIERLGQLIAALPPAPEGWVTAAQLLPDVRRRLDGLVERALADAELRSRLVADLEATLAEAGIEPTRQLAAEVRDRLDSS